MAEFPPKFSSTLVTPDPQYLPGYAGYCPQFKFRLGETYGKLTAKLLSDPNVSRSGQFVLQNSYAPFGDTEAELGDEFMRNRATNRRNPHGMIPGYTGFIPKSRNYFSRTYGATCREALYEFARDEQNRKRSAASAHLPHIDNGTYRPYSTPLTPINKEAVPYKSPKPWRPLDSPYSMEENHPYKSFISGYTGFIPKSRYLFGSSYPINSKMAMIQFDKEQKIMRGTLQLKEAGDLPPVTTLYPSDRGMLPCYTGHVPGYKFCYGQTFGVLTHNALELNRAQKGR
ncbi:hypothetical protein AAFF_G00072670 [Aldrovandia affinis]|uniref:Ciliary microtubule inner protein 2B n=1 Tax=Aldrovandia affinis TaxID=143900 RepID=A0AAD7RYQ2_9TELE|nr:hypothetical protein AAFF_G00072670 [Aldrovandia affinis]